MLKATLSITGHRCTSAIRCRPRFPRHTFYPERRLISRYTLNNDEKQFPWVRVIVEGTKFYMINWKYEKLAKMKSDTLISGAALLAALLAMMFGSCNSSTIPAGASAVKPFDVIRYTGKWFEIARLDFKHEEGLNNVTAEYSLNDDGTIKVVNRGFDYTKQKWEEATGKARFVGSENEAKLEVSFFGPFYSGYNVIAIDPEYRYALVAGENLEYLWLLSRATTMPESIKQDYLARAQAIGFNTADLVWVEHDRN